MEGPLAGGPSLFWGSRRLAPEIRQARSAISRARGMTQIAREAGLSREAMYQAFRRGGNPTLETLASVVKALGMKLSIQASP
jgi:probable addiction module antidote protein